MALMNIKFFSEVLGRNTDVNVIIPQKRTNGEIGQKTCEPVQKYKTLLLLHGLSDDNTIWQRRTSIERYAIERNLAVIMPNADRSYYTDMKYGDKYYTFISSEVLSVVRQFLPLSTLREDNFIAGNSMGGYGALKIALRNPDKFCKCGAFSPAVNIFSSRERHGEIINNIFHDEISPEDDVLYLLKKLSLEQIKPKIFITIGESDFLCEENVAFNEMAKEINYPIEFEVGQGVHDWKFWDAKAESVLDWMLK